MSRIREDYESTKSYRFFRFFDGEEAEVSEEQVPEEVRLAQAEAVRKYEKEHTVGEAPRKVRKAEHLETDVTGMQQKERDDRRVERIQTVRGYRWFKKVYSIVSVVLCLVIIVLLCLTVSYLPSFGAVGNPTNNEVAKRYIESGQEETGIVNVVTGMILQYRAFDTFGETNVLFVATCTVMILLLLAHTKGREEKDSEDETLEERQPDIILQMAAKLLLPIIFVFGIYILLNGHLSPGGGFSGGAILGAGLVLYNSAFGFGKTRKFFDHKVYEVLKVGSLCLYACIIFYYLFTGANGLTNIVPLGKAGALLSSGLILPINVLVGIEVACTMYAFFALFRRGGL